MLRRVILASAEFGVSTCGGWPGLNCSHSRVCCTTGQKLHKTKIRIYYKSPNKRFNPNYDLMGFVARPGKSVSTTGRDLCQDFFMVNLVFFNAGRPEGCRPELWRGNRDAAIREFVESVHFRRKPEQCEKPAGMMCWLGRSSIRIFGKIFQNSGFDERLSYENADKLRQVLPMKTYEQGRD